jgi:hypothetical protein
VSFCFVSRIWGLCKSVICIYIYIYIFVCVCVCVCVSLIYSLCLLRLYMWNRSIVFIMGHFFTYCNIFMVFSMVLYVCCVSSICYEYLEFGLLFRIDVCVF